MKRIQIGDVPYEKLKEIADKKGMRIGEVIYILTKILEDYEILLKDEAPH